MAVSPRVIFEWVFGPGPTGPAGRLWPRWLWLRALGLLFYSAFFSLLFQIQGLIGPDGILPAGDYLRLVHERLGATGFWYAPTLFWLGSGHFALALACWAGLVASVLLVFNFWPRASIAVCLACYLSFVTAAQDFSSYQSDGMLLEAGFLSLFFAPAGLRPGLGLARAPSRASLFLLQWEWFRIYFESGLVKIMSHDPQWRSLTALDHYYENGPLPNWIGWYVQQLPHGFHAVTAFATITIELGLAWSLFLGRRARVTFFFIATAFQLGIILTANLAFLNHLVLALGVLLLDDRFLSRPMGWMAAKLRRLRPKPVEAPAPAVTPVANISARPRQSFGFWRLAGQAFSGFCLSWIFYDTTLLLLFMFSPRAPLPIAPVVALEPFRVANQYGLFAVMTSARYEIEFQGSRDGKNWVAYPFRYKPQDPAKPPRFYAPYQPRFDWDLWFASLGSWREYLFVVKTEQRLLENSSSVLGLFAGNPFGASPPVRLRAVIWQYSFTDLRTRYEKGLWWQRKFLGLYAPTLEREANGQVVVVEWPGGAPPADLAP